LRKLYYNNKMNQTTFKDNTVISDDINYTLYFDGGSRGNPGIGGSGFVIYDNNGQELETGYEYLGDNVTNNKAEYSGLINGLKIAIKNQYLSLHIKGDSKLIINQLNKVWSAKVTALLYEETLALLKMLVKFTAEHVPRNENKHADRLANTAMSSKTSNNCGSIEHLKVENECVNLLDIMKEIKEMKSDISEIKDMLNAVYETLVVK
jgi:ribonuclease HI